MKVEPPAEGQTISFLGRRGGCGVKQFPKNSYGPKTAENNLCKGIKPVLSTNPSYTSYCPPENVRPKGKKNKKK